MGGPLSLHVTAGKQTAARREADTCWTASGRGVKEALTTGGNARSNIKSINVHIKCLVFLMNQRMIIIFKKCGFLTGEATHSHGFNTEVKPWEEIIYYFCSFAQKFFLRQDQNL